MAAKMLLEPGSLLSPLDTWMGILPLSSPNGKSIALLFSCFIMGLLFTTKLGALEGMLFEF